jgi:ABC-type Mn2+/Zn2+ transport system ATPase subunit
VSVQPPAVKKDVGNNQTAQSSRLVVMVVDDLHIYKERTDRAKEIARQVLAHLGPESSMTDGSRSASRETGFVIG